MLQMLMMFAALSAPIGPPETRVERTVLTMHGEEVIDDFLWLEALEADSPEVAAWTSAQNEWTRARLDVLPGREVLEARLGELLRTDSIFAPTRRGVRHFYRYRPADRNQAQLVVREQVDGASRVLIDPESIDAEGLIALDWFEPSPDGRLVAFGLSRAGDEMSVLHLLDVATGTWLADEISGKVSFGGWHPDGDGFLYGVLEDPSDAYSRAWRYHEIGRHHRHNPLLIRQEEPSRIPGARLSPCGDWIIVRIFEGWARQEVFAVDALAWFSGDPPTRICLACGPDARFEPQFVRDDRLYMLTTYQAPTGRLVAIDLTSPDEEDWETVIEARENATLNSAAQTADRIVATFTINATTQVEMYGFGGESLGEVTLPGIGSASISAHHEAHDLFVSFTSFHEPPTIYRFEPRRGERTRWARPEIPVDSERFVVEQVWTTSADGAAVPMFILRRRDIQPDGRRPTILYGYGGFNISVRPTFRASVLPFVEAGGLYVSATLRGGGEFGEAWHRAGMLDRKQNVFDDFHAVAEHLIDGGWTSPEHLAAWGGSNGGLLTGVAAVQRPNLYRAIVSAVPLLDMLRFPEFLMARFWVPEYGDPGRAEDFRWIRAYSPYHNLLPGQTYPAMLITAGENDTRVHPMHARKMVALAQRDAANDPVERPILLWVDREGGHGQGKPLRLQIRDAADVIGFMAWQTGLSFADSE